MMTRVEITKCVIIHPFIHSIHNLIKIIETLVYGNLWPLLLFFLSVLFSSIIICFPVILLRSVLLSFNLRLYSHVLKLIILWQNSIHQCLSIIVIIIVYALPAASSLDGDLMANSSLELIVQRLQAFVLLKIVTLSGYDST